jgi:prolyl-tRNA editing enzyme YbaK/EbsC (Cys-tRNA(Pro) deacylase)
MASSEAPGQSLAAPVERVRAALAAFGHPDTIIAVPESARTAKGAAEAVGCGVAQIAKSIVFRTQDEAPARAVLVITSGANRVDPARVEAIVGVRVAQAEAEWVLAETGFAVGGVAPVGHLVPPLAVLDEDLCRLDSVWAAAGAPDLVFRTTGAELKRMSGARVASVRQAGRSGDRPR